MSAYVILNPYANRWKAKERLPEVRQALEAAGIDYHLVESDAPNHAIQLAASASSNGFSPIIAAGGDGTISEVINGLYKASEGVLGPFRRRQRHHKHHGRPLAHRYESAVEDRQGYRGEGRQAVQLLSSCIGALERRLV